MLEQARIILAKKAAERPITAEDFQTLNRVVDLIESPFAARAEERRKARDDARKAVPLLFWQMPLSPLGLEESMAEQLVSRGFETVGHIMAAVAYDANDLKVRARLDEDALITVQEQLATADLPKSTEDLEAYLIASGETMAQVSIDQEEVVDEEEAKPALDLKTDQADQEVELESELVEMVDEPAEPVEKIAALYEEPPPEIQIPSVEPEPKAEPAPVLGKQPKATQPAPAPVIRPARREEGERIEPPTTRRRQKKQKRQLVFDEDAGALVTRRKRGRGDDAADWDEFSG